jgi:hypothetical protein
MTDAPVLFGSAIGTTTGQPVLFGSAIGTPVFVFGFSFN